MRTALTIACALLGAAPLPSPAVAQDQRPDARRAEQGERSEAQRRDAHRAWVVRRLEESRAEQARLENMLRRLDAGEPVPDFRRPQRDGREGREGREGRRGDGRADARHDRDGQPPSLDERARVVARFAREHFPEFAQRLESELERDPAAAHRIASRFWPRVAELREIEKTQPELFRVEIARLRSGEEIMSTVRRARDAGPLDEKARERLIGHLRQLAERHFELRVEAIRLRLESLRQSVRETERELEERRAERERSVDEQVQRFLRMIDREDGDEGDRDRHRDRPRGGG